MKERNMAKSPELTPGQPANADELKAGGLTPEQQAILDAATAKATRSAELKAKRDDERAKREGETKADAFKRIGSRRVNFTLDEIAKLKPLSDTAAYEYTEDQTTAIVTALRKAIDDVETAFANKGVARKASGFSI